MQDVGLVIIVLVALGFDYTNGFHDAANAIATAIGTRALKPVSAMPSPTSGPLSISATFRRRTSARTPN